jgi:hypothetical protein
MGLLMACRLGSRLRRASLCTPSACSDRDCCAWRIGLVSLPGHGKEAVAPAPVEDDTGGGAANGLSSDRRRRGRLSTDQKPTYCRNGLLFRNM